MPDFDDEDSHCPITLPWDRNVPTATAKTNEGLRTICDDGQRSRITQCFTQRRTRSTNPQPARVPEKSVLHLQSSELVAILKAEIAKCWESIQGAVKTAQNETAAGTGCTGAVLGIVQSEGPRQIITQGHEITPEYDERRSSGRRQLLGQLNGVRLDG